MRVHSGTAPADARRYSDVMTLEEMKISAVIAWALVWSVIAVSFVSSVGNWMVLASAGVMPSLMILWTWQPIVQTLPVTIHGTRQ